MGLILFYFTLLEQMSHICPSRIIGSMHRKRTDSSTRSTAKLLEFQLHFDDPMIQTHAGSNLSRFVGLKGSEILCIGKLVTKQTIVNTQFGQLSNESS